MSEQPTDPLSKVVIDNMMTIRRGFFNEMGGVDYEATSNARHWMLDWNDIDWIGAWLDRDLPAPFGVAVKIKKEEV